MLISDRKRAEFSSKDMVQDLNRLLRAKRGETVASNTLPELDKQVSKQKEIRRFHLAHGIVQTQSSYQEMGH